MGRAFLSTRVYSEPSERGRPAARNKGPSNFSLIPSLPAARLGPLLLLSSSSSTPATVWHFPPAPVRYCVCAASLCPLQYPGGSLSLHLSLVHSRSRFAWPAVLERLLPSGLLSLRRRCILVGHSLFPARHLGQREALDGTYYPSSSVVDVVLVTRLSYYISSAPPAWDTPPITLYYARQRTLY